MPLQRLVRRPQGMTLTEILVTLAIIGMLVGIGLPTYTSQMPKYRLNAAARQVLTDLLLARKLAMSEVHVVQVSFRQPHHYLIWQDRNDDGHINSGELITKDVSDHGVTLRANNQPRFHPTGTVTHLATIVLRHRSAPQRLQRCLSISIAGRVKQTRCKPST
jgi:type IV fimbrial biogenesis protein FimT